MTKNESIQFSKNVGKGATVYISRASGITILVPGQAEAL